MAELDTQTAIAELKRRLNDPGKKALHAKFREKIAELEARGEAPVVRDTWTARVDQDKRSMSFEPLVVTGSSAPGRDPRKAASEMMRPPEGQPEPGPMQPTSDSEAVRKFDTTPFMGQPNASEYYSKALNNMSSGAGANAAMGSIARYAARILPSVRAAKTAAGGSKVASTAMGAATGVARGIPETALAGTGQARGEGRPMGESIEAGLDAVPMGAAVGGAIGGAGGLATGIRSGTSKAASDIRIREEHGNRPSYGERGVQTGRQGNPYEALETKAKQYGQGDEGADFRQYLANQGAQDVAGDLQRQVQYEGQSLGRRRAIERGADEQVGFSGEGNRIIDATPVVESLKATGDPAILKLLDKYGGGARGIESDGVVQMRRPGQGREARRQSMESRSVTEHGADNADMTIYPGIEENVMSTPRATEARMGDMQRTVSERGPMSGVSTSAGTMDPITIPAIDPRMAWKPTGQTSIPKEQATGGYPMSIRDLGDLKTELDSMVTYRAGQLQVPRESLPEYNAANTIRNVIDESDAARSQWGERSRLRTSEGQYHEARAHTTDVLRRLGYEQPSIDRILGGELGPEQVGNLAGKIRSYGEATTTGGQHNEAIEFLRSLSPAYRDAIDPARLQLAQDRMSILGDATSQSMPTLSRAIQLKEPLTARVAYPSLREAEGAPAGLMGTITAAAKEKTRKNKRDREKAARD